jgi:putative transcriptional regulator
MMTNPRYLAGKFLLAMPGIGDLRFERAVIAMCSHDDQGALGIGIGHFVPRMGLHNLLSQFDIPTDNIIDAPVHQGGPVEPQRGFVLHSLDWGGQGTVQVNKLWGLSGTLDILRVIGRPQGPSKWLVALGYAGWGAGQLDGEMLRHGWHVAPANHHLLFETIADQRWAAAFTSSGIDPRMLASDSGHA